MKHNLLRVTKETSDKGRLHAPRMTRRIGQLTCIRGDNRITIKPRYENSPLDNARSYLYHLIVLHKKKLGAAPVAWSACHTQIRPSAFLNGFVLWVILKLTRILFDRSLLHKKNSQQKARIKISFLLSYLGCIYNEYTRSCYNICFIVVLS